MAALKLASRPYKAAAFSTAYLLCALLLLATAPAIQADGRQAGRGNKRLSPFARFHSREEAVAALAPYDLSLSKPDGKSQEGVQAASSSSSTNSSTTITIEIGGQVSGEHRICHLRSALQRSLLPAPCSQLPACAGMPAWQLCARRGLAVSRARSCLMCAIHYVDVLPLGSEECVE